MSGRQKIVIVGAGVGGLTAAHELIERGFDVEVFDRRWQAGGKAASVRVDLAGGHSSKSRDFVPGEHGFRFFPGWYRHLPDTLGRIPSDRHREHRGDRTVRDHLVTVGSNLLASYNRDPIPIVLHAPRSADQAQKLLSFVVGVQKMGLSWDEAVLFFGKLIEFLSVPDDVRRQKYDKIAWTTFIDEENRTPAFRVLAAHTRTLVAAKATEASAYTIATMAVRTLFGSSLTVDRVLDGPTSEVWIDPWVRHLEGQGVKFHFGYDMDTIRFDGKGSGIASLTFSPIDRQYFKAAEREKRFGEYAAWRHVRDKDGTTKDTFDAADLALLRKLVPDHQKVHARSAAPDNQEAADYFVFALPIEQMAYFINRSSMMTFHDGSLRNVVRLSGSTDWMAGIQFYLRIPLNLEPGHIVCSDSEWALTAIDQTQFWRNVRLPDGVQSIVSVDISQWDKKGRFNNKEAFRCTKDEIAEEVWKQLKASFNRDAGRVVFNEAMLLTGKLKGSFHLDDNVAERFDRRKQGDYSRAQAVRFSADERLSPSEGWSETPFVFGERIEMNIEPILVNRPGSLALRPSAETTEIPNMFFAADYVDTATNLACMEGANEAARLAVNAILDRAGSTRDRCQTWDFADGDVLSTVATFAQMIEQGPGVRRSIGAAASAATTLGAMATRAGQNLLQFWKKR